MNIVLDVMGGDHGPAEIIAGAIEAARAYNVTISLVGKPDLIKAELAKHNTAGLKLPVVPATQVIEMEDKPANVVRAKPDSSMVVGCKMVHSGEAQAFVTAGNTGGAMACGMFVVGRIQELWQPDTAALYGLEDVGGIVNPLSLQQWQAQWEATGGRATRAYDMLNVKYVIVRDGTPLPEGKFELAFDDEGELAIYRNRNFIPRAWVVHEARLASDEEDALVQVQAPDFEPLATVILLDNEELQGSTPFGPLPDSPPTGATSSATINTATNSALTIAVDAVAPGFLVLSELWYPGWQATVHGTEQTTEHNVLHANGSLRAIPIPAGRSTVELHFRPAGWGWGRALAGLGLIAIAVMILSAQRTRRLQRIEDATGRIPTR